MPIWLFAQDAIISKSYTAQPMEVVMLDIATHFKVDLIFHSSYFKDQPLVNVTLTELPVNKALDLILKSSNIRYNLKDNEIVLTKLRIISGYIKNQSDHESLISATVFNEETYTGVTTNDFGFFSYEIPYEVTKIKASYIGFEQVELEVDSLSNSPIYIFLKPKDFLDPVVIKPTSSERLLSVESNQHDLITSDINSKLSTGGEPDINQFLFSQSGVSSGPDGIGGLHVRGGNSEHNLMLLDGVRIYQPNHAFGLFSIFNTALLRNARFSKYNFHPKYFDGIASAVDMQLKEGSTKSWGGNVSVSTLATQLNVNGPLIKDKTSILASARMSQVNPLIKLIGRNDVGEQGTEVGHWFQFQDFNIKLSHKVSDKTRIFLSFYSGNDSYDNAVLAEENDEGFQWEEFNTLNLNFGNYVAALRWNQLYGEKLFSNTILSFSNYRYKSSSISTSAYLIPSENEDYESRFEYDFNSGVREWSLKQDYEYFAASNSLLSIGISHTFTTFDPGIFDDVYYEHENDVETNDSFYFESTLYDLNNTSMYVNYDVHLSKFLFLQVGGKYSRVNSYDYFLEENSVFNLFQGRIALSGNFREKLRATLSYEELTQPFHLLTGSNIGFPNDLWVPSFGEIEPQRASQINLNLNYTPDSKFTFDCSFFGKYLDNLIRYPDESNLPSIADRFDEGWEEAVVVGNGISLGIEVDLVYKSEKVNMFLAYTLSKYDRQFDEINDGEAFPFIFDQNQNLSFDFNYKINPRLNLYLNWKYSRGIRQTLFETEFTYSPFENINPGEFGEIGDINADQLPDYHRLDVGGIITFGRRTKHQIVIGIQNLYNRKNIYYRYRMIPFMDENGNKLGSASIQNIEALPLIPTLRYSFEF